MPTIKEDTGRAGADHPVAAFDHSPHERFPILAVTWPITAPEHNVGGFSQTGARITRVDGLQCEEPAGQSYMRPAGRRNCAKCPHRGDLGVETIIIGYVEVKHDRAARRRARNDIEPNDLTATVDQQILAVQPV